MIISTSCGGVVQLICKNPQPPHHCLEVIYNGLNLLGIVELVLRIDGGIWRYYYHDEKKTSVDRLCMVVGGGRIDGFYNWQPTHHPMEAAVKVGLGRDSCLSERQVGIWVSI